MTITKNTNKFVHHESLDFCSVSYLLTPNNLKFTIETVPGMYSDGFVKIGLNHTCTIYRIINLSIYFRLIFIVIIIRLCIRKMVYFTEWSLICILFMNSSGFVLDKWHMWLIRYFCLPFIFKQRLQMLHYRPVGIVLKCITNHKMCNYIMQKMMRAL